MEVDDIQNQACKFPRIRSGANKIGQKGDDVDEVEPKRFACENEIGRFCGWPSSRIVRVSRASGGKDRHSKVWTSKGLRDRRVRLSVTTAIQFYDLQDRLGYDQPSKAVEWLLKAAESSISELPSLNTSFPGTPKQVSDEKRSSVGTTEHGFDSNDLDLDMDPNHHQNRNVSLSKSGCSSTSETSKGSGGLSISRSESRMKARERARGRAAGKEKEKETDSLFSGGHHHHNVTPISHSSSFTELLTGGTNNNSTSNSPNGSAHQLHKSSSRQWPHPIVPMDYFGTGPGHSSAGYSLPQSMMVSPFTVTSGDQHHELQQFSFVQDNLVPVATATGGSDYNLNFSISSGLAGYNRGTLQSNSPSLLPQLQRFSPIDGSHSPFFIGSAAPNGNTTENHHQHQHQQFPTGFNAGLQLYYGDASRHSDNKGKGKN